MKLVMIFDQIQAGAGGKEKAMESLHGKTGPIGSSKMFEPFFKKMDVQVIGTLYCGDAFYEANREDVANKMTAMIKKLNPDAVLCGPAFNYAGYAKMAAELTEKIQDECQIPVVAACSEENQETIQNFKDKIKIVKMPKKGGIGLNNSLETMTTLLHKMVNHENVTSMIESDCY